MSKITLEQIEALIKSEYYTHGTNGWTEAKNHVAENNERLHTLTTCVLYLHSGFMVVGTSACVEIADYDYDIGMKVARQKAIDQIWQVEGYHRMVSGL
jgi:hypothetical protein